jgi:hypothetical protein
VSATGGKAVIAELTSAIFRWLDYAFPSGGAKHHGLTIPGRVVLAHEPPFPRFFFSAVKLNERSVPHHLRLAW